jgi:hypothetical protein
MIMIGFLLGVLTLIVMGQSVRLAKIEDMERKRVMAIGLAVNKGIKQAIIQAKKKGDDDVEFWRMVENGWK